MSTVPESRTGPLGEIGNREIAKGLRALSRAFDLDLAHEYVGAVQVDLTQIGPSTAIDITRLITAAMDSVSIIDGDNAEGVLCRTMAGRLMLMPVEIITVAEHTDDLALTLIRGAR